MNRKRKINCITMISVLLMVSLSLVNTMPEIQASYQVEEINQRTTMKPNSGAFVLINDRPSAVAVCDSNPFYALIATPITIYYDDEGVRNVAPLYVKNFDNPSTAVIRAEEDIDITVDYIIDGTMPIKEASLDVATRFWETSTGVLLLKNDETGYNLGIAAVPLASYLNIPVIVTDAVDQTVGDVLTQLGVTKIYVCGDVLLQVIEPIEVITFDTIDDIIQENIDVLSDRFDTTVNYITIANPRDITEPEVLESIEYDFSGTIASVMALPTQTVGSFLHQSAGIHEFIVPEEYKYAHIHIIVKNRNSEHSQALGDRINMLVLNPHDDRIFYATTAGGIPIRDTAGTIVQDQLHLEITIYNDPGTYTLQVFGQWFASQTGDYDIQVVVEKLEHPYVPLMKGISSLAPYLTAYHQGIVFAKPSFAFAADDHVLYNGLPCPGTAQPGANPKLMVPSNEHTLQIHGELNSLLSHISGIPLNNLKELRDHFAVNPIYIAIIADPTMVPMYFFDNPDGHPDDPAHIMGFGTPSDFIYGDIDIKPDDPANNTYSYWPFQENIVGRVNGWDAQDVSALLARTVFYHTIIQKLGEWKNNAVVQLGAGVEFQNLPVITRINHLLYPGRGEPTKFPTGQNYFTGGRMTEVVATGGYNVTTTYLLESQREGFSAEDLKIIKTAGLLNRLLFPAKFIEFLNSDEKVTGGQDQLSSNLIFTYAHGSYNLYEHGDVFIDSRGFPFVTMFTRIYPMVRSGLSTKGSYDVRSVENMELGPSVIFVKSCITGRTDGIHAKNTLSQAYIHAGVNAYIGATRVTAGSGYLEPRPLPGGWGIGVLGLLKATIDLRLRGEYPDMHLGSLIGEDFIIELIDNNVDTGTALRNAKNIYLYKDANTTFLWNPPLPLTPWFSESGYTQPGRMQVLDKKYVALHEFTLYGDPAFNPYQPVNQ